MGPTRAACWVDTRAKAMPTAAMDGTTSGRPVVADKTTTPTAFAPSEGGTPNIALRDGRKSVPNEDSRCAEIYPRGMQLTMKERFDVQEEQVEVVGRQLTYKKWYLN